jgi:K+-transporting ATPase KdpF subunit
MRYFSQDFSEAIAFIFSKKNRIPLSLFLLLCFNTLLAPVVQAATPGAPSPWQSYTISLLGLTVVSLCIYLFVVIFQPERF